MGWWDSDYDYGDWEVDDYMWGGSPDDTDNLDWDYGASGGVAGAGALPGAGSVEYPTTSKIAYGLNKYASDWTDSRSVLELASRGVAGVVGKGIGSTGTPATLNGKQAQTGLTPPPTTSGGNLSPPSESADYDYSTQASGTALTPSPTGTTASPTGTTPTAPTGSGLQGINDALASGDLSEIEKLILSSLQRQETRESEYAGLQDLLLEEQGFRRTEDGGFERIPQEEDELTGLLRQRAIQAARGELPIEDVERQLEQARERVIESTTRGGSSLERALSDFELDAVGLRENARRGLLDSTTAALRARELGLAGVEGQEFSQLSSLQPGNQLTQYLPSILGREYNFASLGQAGKQQGASFDFQANQAQLNREQQEKSSLWGAVGGLLGTGISGALYPRVEGQTSYLSGLFS